MPGTYRLFKIENPLSITQNIYATVAYVAQLATYFPEKNNIQDLTIASYHRGEMFVKRHIKNLGKRTESYVQKIKKRYKKIEGKTPTTNAEPQ
jgi:soluble lytic murein transglycosylase-like protein